MTYQQLILTRPQRLVLDWIRAEQGDRPSFRLRYERLQEETGLSQRDAGYSVDALRRAGHIEIVSTPLPHRKHYCRLADPLTPFEIPRRHVAVADNYRPLAEKA
jgi:hypothetical protein